jgi:hypothetical protein
MSQSDTLLGEIKFRISISGNLQILYGGHKSRETLNFPRFRKIGGSTWQGDLRQSLSKPLEAEALAVGDGSSSRVPLKKSP